MSADATPPQGWWYCRSVRADGSTSAFFAVRSSLHADGVQVDLPEADAAQVIGDDALSEVRLDPAGVVTLLHVTPLVAAKAPPLWFAELDQPDASPPTRHVVGFSGHGIEPGRLVDRQQLREIDVTSADQVGALQWYPATGEIVQVYVAPDWRRRHVATAVMMAGGALHLARGGAQRLWADGQRTALGDRFAKRATWEHRAAPLTHLAPPMTPFDQR